MAKIVCNCITEVEARVLKHAKEQGMKATKASLKEVGFFFSPPSTKTLSHIELTIDGKKRPSVLNMVHSFCPFCGKLYQQ